MDIYTELRNYEGAYATHLDLYNEYDSYENVTFNIWLFKGVHHFVQCEEFLFLKHFDETKDYCVDYNERVSDQYYSNCDNFDQSTETCINENNAFNCKEMTITQDTLCKTLQTYFPLRKTEQKKDNVKYYIRPLECKLAKDYFLDMSRFNSPVDAFYENCIDLEAGDAKPQIRVHGRAAFNITNFAQFENIEFTGEDNLI